MCPKMDGSSMQRSERIHSASSPLEGAPGPNLGDKCGSQNPQPRQVRAAWESADPCCKQSCEADPPPHPSRSARLGESRASDNQRLWKKRAQKKSRASRPGPGLQPGWFWRPLQSRSNQSGTSLPDAPSDTPAAAVSLRRRRRRASTLLLPHRCVRANDSIQSASRLLRKELRVCVSESLAPSENSAGMPEP